jgi:hypothetical protein
VTKAYSEDFAELTALAEKRLLHPEVDLPHHQEIFRLWRYPSFEQYVTWHVYSSVARYAEPPIAVKVSWDRPFDVARFRDPMKGLAHGLSTEPTIISNQVELSRNELESKLSSLQSIKLPVVIDRSIVLDGERCGFESFGATGVKLTWSTVPESWKSFVQWAEAMIAFIKSATDSHG